MAASGIVRLTDHHLGALIALEQAAFMPADQQSPRSLRYLLVKAHADIWGKMQKADLLASIIVLYRRGSEVARVYSIATDQCRRQKGLGRQLLRHAEQAAATKGCRRMRAEVRENNPASRRLFEHAGYDLIGRLPGYYPNGEDGMHYEKQLTAIRSGAAHG